MNSSWDGSDPQVLQAFLYDLISQVKRPEETELLVEVILNIQQPPGVPRTTLSPAIPNQSHSVVRVPSQNLGDFNSRQSGACRLGKSKSAGKY
jgi:hypothetical protein